MDHFSELSTILSYSLDWNKARVAWLVQILSALFKVRSVNLTQIAVVFQLDATEASSYRRIQRFFINFSFDLSFILGIVSKLFLVDEGFVLIKDRTNWRWVIETLFGCLKSRGFNIEDTHITEPAKIEKLLSVVAIAFSFAYKKGELKSKIKPIKIKTPKEGKQVFLG